MEQANVLVALGGDRGNSVPKTVTAGEIAILQAIHGPDAVYNIEPVKEKLNRSNQNEVQRLRAVYGTARDEDGMSYIAKIYPGMSATVPTSIKSLGLDKEYFKPTARAAPADEDSDDVDVAALGSMGVKESAGNTAYEPIEVPADPEYGNPADTGMTDPRSQPQIDLPPGLATASTATAVKDALVAQAEKLADAQPKDDKVQSPAEKKAAAKAGSNFG